GREARRGSALIATLRPGGLVTMLFALAAAIVPLPDALAAFRPAWAAVVLLYWALAAPDRYGLIAAVLMGLALDALTGTLLGEHAFGLLVIVYLAQRFYLQLRAFPTSQLVLTIAALLALYEFLLFWIDGVAGVTVAPLERWAPVSSGCLMWLVFWYLFDGERPETPARL
ncbi:MAG TPA: rod shape-determining protein MreD, partial [Gammaproteobacteria bacterium]|nr:rod shape-determining protein MreD [Gammaproteobacteria bacterium]